VERIRHAKSFLRLLIQCMHTQTRHIAGRAASKFEPAARDFLNVASRDRTGNLYARTGFRRGNGEMLQGWAMMRIVAAGNKGREP
jgi:hypothetical protein